MGKVWRRAVQGAQAGQGRPWSAMAIRAAHCGAASLVPPNWPQGVAVPLLYES